MYTVIMAGLRERKKQQTRQRISDIATGLFLERGFDAVTIAEIAEVAEVSVNTVYNYFPSKEDLFFDREEEQVERSSRQVRERRPGESAARAVLRGVRADVRPMCEQWAVDDGMVRFMRCVRESPSLMARVFVMRLRIVDRLTGTLREEAGAPEGDPVAEMLAIQLAALSDTVFRTIQKGLGNGEALADVAPRVLAKVDAFEALLSEEALNYATRPAECSAD
jgi:AcrR family transcriptional regulator